jgi:transposase
VKALREVWFEFQKLADAGKLVFLDESGVNISMARLYGRAEGGNRAIGSVPQNWGENVTLVAGITSQGLRAPMQIDGAMDGEVFLLYVQEILAPTLSEGEIVVLDNLKAHKVAGVREAIEARGARVEYLPPYSPDLNPIEKCWSKVKAILRAIGARTSDTLAEAITTALSRVTAAEAKAWIRYCGYLLNQVEN